MGFFIMKFRLLLLSFILMLSSCSTIEAMFGDEPAQANRDGVATENSELKSEIAALRQELQQLDRDIEAHKSGEVARQEAEAKASLAASQRIANDRLWVTVSFRSGYMELTRQSRSALKRLAEKFLSKSRVQTIDVRGYTDDEPIGGYANNRHTPRHPYSSNLELSQARADNVASALIKAGISDAIVHAEGFGASNFAADNATAEGRAKNRRAEIHLVKK